MILEQFNIEQKLVDKGMQNDKPFIRISEGKGCNCCCDNKYWISISNGTTGFTAHFDNKKEYETFLKNGEVEGEVKIK